MNVTLAVFVDHLRNADYPIEAKERAQIASMIEVIDHEFARHIDALQRIALMTGYHVPAADLAAGLPTHIAFMLAGENQ